MIHPQCAVSKCKKPRRRQTRGFTLIETSLATVILGVGVLALIESQQDFMRMNRWSSNAATAAYMANEVREVMRNMPKHDPVTGLHLGGEGDLSGWGPEIGESSVRDFDDLDDFDGFRFDAGGTDSVNDFDQVGPIDGFRSVIPQIDNDGALVLDETDNIVPLSGWSQRVTVEKLDPLNLGLIVADDYEIEATGGYQGLPVDDFPVRVTVRIFFQDFDDTSPSEMTSLVWIVP